ncbi:MAG: hypothetical protein IJ811_04585 [Clostridia bacterium]|nr:hypothetical protein [Clostridia bacterium]
MKRLLSLLVTVMCFGTMLCATTGCAEDTQSKYPVYLIIGQSNASGNGRIEHLPEEYIDIEYDDVMIYCAGTANGTVNGQLMKVGTKVGQGSINTQRFGLEIGIAQTFTQKGYAAGIIKCGFDGSSINLKNTGMGTWWTVKEQIPEGTKDCYFRFLTAVNEGIAAFAQAGYKPEIKGVMWMQGESNPEDESYEADLDKLIAQIRSDLNAPELPFVAGTICYQKPGVYSTFCKANQAIRALANKPNCGFVESGQFGTNPSDTYHWTGTNLVSIGNLFALKIYQMSV